MKVEFMSLFVLGIPIALMYIPMLICYFLIYPMRLFHLYTLLRLRLMNLLIIKRIRIYTTLTKIKLMPGYKYQDVTIIFRDFKRNNLSN